MSNRIEVAKLRDTEQIGYWKATRLIERFETAEGVRNASVAQLQETYGIGPILAARLSSSQPSLAESLVR